MIGFLRHLRHDGARHAVDALCPGSGLAPESARLICDDGAICMGCGRPQLLTPCPSGWGGAVLSDHDRKGGAQ